VRTTLNLLKGADVNLTRKSTRLAAAFVMSAALTVMTAAPAFAHEGRDIGAYKVEVGWINEPTYTGFPNGVALFLNDANDQPVEDLGDTLKVEVSFGEEKSGALNLEPAFGEEFGTKGEYHADLIPTRPGTYTFHFTGTIKGQAVDESFTSSETTFDEAKDNADVQFPVKDPSAGQLSQKIDRIDPRLAAAQQDLAGAKSDADDASSKATIAIVLGAIGIIAAIGMGVVAMRRRSI
jgi:hypothetical protein